MLRFQGEVDRVRNTLVDAWRFESHFRHEPVMDLFGALFRDGRIADVVLFFMAIEAVVLVWFARRYAGGLGSLQVLSALLPGLFLVLALRAALLHSDWVWIALALLGALVTHCIDMKARFQSRASASRYR
jgi:hypothetical protein